MTKPEPMTPEQIELMHTDATGWKVLPPGIIKLAHAIIAARDAQWEKMLGEPVAYAQPNGFEYVSMHHDKYHTIPLYAFGDNK